MIEFCIKAGIGLAIIHLIWTDLVPAIAAAAGVLQ